MALSVSKTSYVHDGVSEASENEYVHNGTGFNKLTFERYCRASRFNTGPIRNYSTQMTCTVTGRDGYEPWRRTASL